MVSFDDIKKSVIDIINSHIRFNGDLTELWEDIGIDSHDTLEIIMACEEKFNIKITANEMNASMSSGMPAQTLLFLIEKKLSQD